MALWRVANSQLKDRNPFSFSFSGFCFSFLSLFPLFLSPLSSSSGSSTKPPPPSRLQQTHGLGVVWWVTRSLVTVWLAESKWVTVATPGPPSAWPQGSWAAAVPLRSIRSPGNGLPSVTLAAVSLEMGRLKHRQGPFLHCRAPGLWEWN